MQSGLGLPARRWARHVLESGAEEGRGGAEGGQVLEADAARAGLATGSLDPAFVFGALRERAGTALSGGGRDACYGGQRPGGRGKEPARGRGVGAPG